MMPGPWEATAGKLWVFQALVSRGLSFHYGETDTIAIDARAHQDQAHQDRTHLLGTVNPTCRLKSAKPLQSAKRGKVDAPHKRVLWREQRAGFTNQPSPAVFFATSKATH